MKLLPIPETMIPGSPECRSPAWQNRNAIWHSWLVDDETASTDNLAPCLERAGFKVPIAADGGQARQQVTRSLPDLNVMDVLMPNDG
jgi:DNA-binding NtrC family response regulator